MVEIYNIDISSHERYAKDQSDIEEFQKTFHIEPARAGSVAVQTRILDLTPKLPAIVLLMHTSARISWARFEVPAAFFSQRFVSSYVAPSLGSSEKQEADIERIRAILEEGDQEGEDFHEEGAALINMLQKGVIENNEMVDYIKARISQFIQG